MEGVCAVDPRVTSRRVIVQVTGSSPHATSVIGVSVVVPGNVGVDQVIVPRPLALICVIVEVGERTSVEKSEV